MEKPQEGLTESRLASVVFYCVQSDTLSYLSDFLDMRPQAAGRSFGQFWVRYFSRIIIGESCNTNLTCNFAV